MTQKMALRPMMLTLLLATQVCTSVYALGPYTIERLQEESDVIVICTVHFSSIVKNDSGYSPETCDMFLTRIQPMVYMRGTATESDLIVRHFGVKHDHGLGTGGKAARFFRFNGVAETEQETSYLTGPGHYYMMFLKRDGAEFVPTSGQHDARDSIIPIKLTRNQAWIQAKKKVENKP